MTPPDIDRTERAVPRSRRHAAGDRRDAGSVVVPPGLRNCWKPALPARWPLAIVTGRSIGVVDDLLNPFVATAAGEHGASPALQDGKIERCQGPRRAEAWQRGPGRAAERWPGVWSSPSRTVSPCISAWCRSAATSVATGARPGAEGSSVVSAVAGARGRRDRPRAASKGMPSSS